MTEKIKLIAVGTAGTLWAKQLSQKDINEQNILAIGTSPCDKKVFPNNIWVQPALIPVLEHTQDNSQFPLYYSIFQCGESVSQLDEETLNKAEYPSQLKEIKSFLQNTNQLVILLGLGALTSSILAPQITKMTKEMNITTTLVATTPFSWEGAIRRAQAEGTVKLLKQTVNNLIVYDMQQLEKQMPEEKYSKPLFEVADREILKIVQNTLQKLS